MKNVMYLFPVSLKFRLLLMITLVMLSGLIFSGLFIFQNAREAVEAEITSSIELAENMIRSTMQSGAIPPENFSSIPSSIEHLRHVQVIVEHQYIKHEMKKDTVIDGVPDWFVGLVYPRNTLPNQLIIHGRSSEKLVIAADPADEIQEVWKDVRDLLSLAAILFIITLVLIYLAIWHGLKPLKELQKGFEQLEKNNLHIAIDEKAVTELIPLHKSFNQMVSVLQKTTREKQELSRKIISLQEDERSQISRELHDEIGPYLFTIRVNTSSVKQLNIESDDFHQDEINKRLSTIDQTVEQLQIRLRQLLKKLRPMILNDLSLGEALLDLINAFKATEPSTNWQLHYHIEQQLSDAINVTTYRIVQECLTNIGRHAKANDASVVITTEHVINTDDSHSIDLIISVLDDGCGMQNNNHNGLGITGIKERVQALGGDLVINKNEPRGTSISIRLPLGYSDDN